MNAGPDLTTLATAMGDATRIRMLELLMEGRALVAKELAFGTGVSPATATAHLRRLEQARLIRTTRQGRNKVFELATPTVARMVEALMTVAVRGPRASATPEPLRAARYCYDHLAGKLGMGITDALLRAGHLSLRKRAFALTPSGEEWCQDFGIDLATVREQRRHFAHRCLDWSERRDHLAGALGAALAERVFAQGWVERQPGSRGLIVTPAGQRALKRHFGAL